MKIKDRYSKGCVEPKTYKELMTNIEILVERKESFSKEWKISQYGDMTNLRYNYFIDCERLTEKNWIKHMTEKKWCDLNSFIPAYFYALGLRGVKEITITANYQINQY